MTSTEHAAYPLSAKIGPGPLTVGRAPDAKLRLLESTISRRHASLTRANGVIEVNDHESRFGTFVNGDRIRAVSLQPGDRIRFGSVVTYRVHADGLALDEAAHGVNLTAAGLSVSRGGRRLLEETSFQIDSDRFVGILGPSGAGKSTLLNCLATYLPPARGRIVYDGGVDLLERRDEYRAALGHVPQENLVNGPLTARENLTFAARLRLDETQATVEIEDQVDRVLEEVGLTSHADKPAQVLSGGQRKRLSVAVELLKRPRLLLLDEPTSGLDPAAEANLMEEFRHIARRGTTVVCTTHLMDNVRLFDSVLVLGVSGQVGRLAYAGPPNDLFQRFGCRGYADLYEKLETGRFTPLGGEPPIRMPAENAPPALHVTPHSGTVSACPKPDTGTNVSGAVLEIAQLVSATTDKNTWRQIRCLLQRTRLSIGRDRGLLVAMALQPIGLGLLNCLSQASAPRGASMLFFLVVIAIWLGLNNSARDLVRERKLYIRERLAGLRPGAYLASKWLAHTAIGAIQILLLLLVFRLWLSWLPRGALSDELGRASTVWMFCVLMGAYTGALGIGLLLSAAVQTEEAAVAALPLLIMPQLLISPIGVGRAEEILFTAHATLPFHPLGVKLLDPEWLTGINGLVDFLSLGCLSRPALLLIKEPVISSDFGRLIWLADLGHLIVLVLGTWILTIYFFQKAEERWTRLIGVG